MNETINIPVESTPQPPRKRRFRLVTWFLLTPLLLFVTLMVLLYVPPVQNFIQRRVAEAVSESTGLDITIRRIDLRFPLNLLVRDVLVTKSDSTAMNKVVIPVDTILKLSRLNIHVEPVPLFHGRIELDDVELIDGIVNTLDLVPGMSLRGTLGNFSLTSRGIDLSKEEVIINRIALSDTHLNVLLSDTTAAAPDTTSAPLPWKIALRNLTLSDVNLHLAMPIDSLTLSARLNSALIQDADVDLQHQSYAVERFNIEKSGLHYRSGTPNDTIKGFNPSNIRLNNLNVTVDSVLYTPVALRATLRKFIVSERSGLSITSLTARVEADSTTIAVPEMRLETPHSWLRLRADVPFSLANGINKERLNARLDGMVGKTDLLLLAGELPADFVATLPPHPLTLHAVVDGTIDKVKLTPLSVNLPGALTLTGEGEAAYLMDDKKRTGSFKLDLQTYDLTLVSALAGMKTDSTQMIPGTTEIMPDSITLSASATYAEQKLRGELMLNERRIDLSARGGWNSANNRYFARINLDATRLKLFPATLTARLRSDSVGVQLVAGDLNLRVRGNTDVMSLADRGTVFADLLMKQVKAMKLDHAALRRALPGAGIYLTAGPDNPAAKMLKEQGITYQSAMVNFGATPQRGINGRSTLLGVQSGNILLDTISLSVAQDTSRLAVDLVVSNSKQHPHVTFASSLRGEVRTGDADLTLKFTDARGDTGILFGVNARPLASRDSIKQGLLIKLIPERPIIAYRPFTFADRHNWLYLHQNLRVYAGIDMVGENGLGFSLQSDRADTTSLQNVDIALSRLPLADLVKAVPYMPQLTGLLSVDANFVQTEQTIQVAAEGVINDLTYENYPVGNIGVGATWLPVNANTHFVDTYLSVDNRTVATANGSLQADSLANRLDVALALEHLPLSVANAFLPADLAQFAGDVDGELTLAGTTEKPAIDGSATLHEVILTVPSVGAKYRFDERPLRVSNGKLYFDKFAIYTTSENPFTIDGNISFVNLNSTSANLRLTATNYTLLDAPRTRESLAYGKVFVDIDARIRGPLDALTMRGDMHLLGNTNVTYVLTDTPLTVEDRLDGLVSFVSFEDTTSMANAQTPTMSLGGMNMSLGVYIDDAVRLRADLSNDRSKYIELQGGGDLQLRYTPQGDMNLTGRYTLSGGSMKYSLPVIPLKEFQFAPGSYVDWRGDMMNPTLDLKATERMRASVESDDGSDASRTVNFDVSIAIRNKLESPELIFDITAPEDATIANELATMSTEERSKQAITMLATGIYLAGGDTGGGLTLGSALNSVISSQINSLAGGLKNASISVGLEDNTSAETGETHKDFSFRYSQRLFNDRVQVIIGGTVSTDNNASGGMNSFIDNISVEYRLDRGGTHYVRAFHNKNYESIIDGELTETGVGLVLRRKVDRLSELFIFKKKKKEELLPLPTRTSANQSKTTDL